MLFWLALAWLVPLPPSRRVTLQAGSDPRAGALRPRRRAERKRCI